MPTQNSTTNTPTFKLRDVFKSPTKFKQATTLLKPEYIQDLPKLGNKIQGQIKRAYRELYSYVVVRNPEENVPTFFSHASATALYEQHHDLHIHNKDHTKKAGTIFHT